MGRVVKFGIMTFDSTVLGRFDPSRVPRSNADDCIDRRRLLRGVVGSALWASTAAHVSRAATPITAADALAEAELKRAAQKGELCSAAIATGTGLRGEYFAVALDRGPPLMVRTDATVDLDRSLEWPILRVSQKPSAVRWSGWVKPPTPGRYRFHTGQASTRLWVSQQLMAGEGAPADASIELAAGRFYPVKLEADHLENLEGRVRLEWTAPHGARFVIPRALLFLPTDSVPMVEPAAR